MLEISPFSATRSIEYLQIIHRLVTISFRFFFNSAEMFSLDVSLKIKASVRRKRIYKGRCAKRAS